MFDVNADIRVLLIDDQAIVAEAIRRMLDAEADIKFFYCADPMEAIRVADEVQPTVILQDLVMPGIDGMQLLRFLRVNAVTGDIPIIVLSSKEDPKIKSDAFERKASDYLVKIPDRIELIARIRAHARSFLAQKALSETLTNLKEVKDELERKNLELERLTHLDGLTGISNRRRFNQYLEQEWLRALRSKAMISLIMIDIDHFKLFNDNYGHQGGDDVLRRVAQTLEKGVRRPADMAARYGGEEFAVILPETDEQGAAAVAEAMRAAIESLAISHAHSSAADHVTISMGVAVMVPQDDRTPANLIEMADKALYGAKENGRNRFVVYTPELGEQRKKPDGAAAKTKRAAKSDY